MSKNSLTPLSRRENIVLQEYGREILIYDLKRDKAYNLNETASLVWQACDGTRTINEISALIGRKLRLPVSNDFIWLALDGLRKENLLENANELAPPFAGVSRREVIRRIGLISLVALPTISSLIAPAAAHASSLGSTCIQTANPCPVSTNRPAGCTCSPGSAAGTLSAADGGTSNCASGLKCYSGVPSSFTPSGFGNACCP